ncbi:molybdenum cofactor guanylyltransferase [Chondromyces crocatus]|uniref:Probable molybdenum cofactor guanylyltransferase n=1 Tax=Chondromyces crocatus TaxID=52 RepID=A0A0K1E8U5_CHOCO|nr:molybdenum cofactor guanylyltransferase [Chondromyces crocatus]AKT37003.1 molybdopterin-guanine dinucleotide biosynthesis protein A [Chondromyces crocatus]
MSAMTADGKGRVPGLGGVVLCGGQSRRMGRPKAWLDFGGEPLLSRVVGRLAEVAWPIVVVAAPGQEVPALAEEVLIVRDGVEGQGPLRGIAAGLEALAPRAARAYVSATDAPFLAPAFVRRLAKLQEGVDIAVPRSEGHHHPLAAIYACSVRAEAVALLADDRRRPFFLFERVRTRIVAPEELLADAALVAADPTLQSLRNLNTPEEYRAALVDAVSQASS